MPEGKEVDTKQSIEEEDNGEGRALIACGSDLLMDIVGVGFASVRLVSNGANRGP